AGAHAVGLWSQGVRVAEEGVQGLRTKSVYLGAGNDLQVKVGPVIRYPHIGYFPVRDEPQPGTTGHNVILRYSLAVPVQTASAFPDDRGTAVTGPGVRHETTEHRQVIADSGRRRAQGYGVARTHGDRGPEWPGLTGEREPGLSAGQGDL